MSDLPEELTKGRVKSDLLELSPTAKSKALRQLSARKLEVRRGIEDYQNRRKLERELYGIG